VPGGGSGIVHDCPEVEAPTRGTEFVRLPGGEGVRVVPTQEYAVESQVQRSRREETRLGFGLDQDQAQFEGGLDFPVRKNHATGSAAFSGRNNSNGIHMRLMPESASVGLFALGQVFSAHVELLVEGWRARRPAPTGEELILPH